MIARSDTSARPAGRFIDAETIRSIVSAKRSGASDGAAALAGGINRRTLFDWLRRGRAGVAGYVEFAKGFDLAERAAEDDRLEELRRKIADAASV